MARVRRRAAALHLSPALRKVVQDLARQVPAQVGQMLAVERAAIGEYASVPRGELAQDIKAATTAHARIWYDTLLAGRPPGARELETFVDIGRRRQRQGFVLSSLLHAIRLVAIVLWEALLTRARKEHGQELLGISPYLLQCFDMISQAVSHGYTEEVQQSSRWRERLEAELAGLLFSQPENRLRFRELARGLGVDASAPRATLALRLPAGDKFDPGHLAQVGAALGVAPAAMVGAPRDGVQLLWVPAPAGEPLVTQEQALARDVAGLLGPGRGLLAAGLGLPAAGPAGWRESAEQALQALEIGAAIGQDSGLLRYATLAMDDAVRASRGLTRYLESLVERLAAEPALVETLECFFARRQHRKACAAALGIHVNTLAHRLERIEFLLGAQLDDPAWLARLYAALHLRARPAAPGARRRAI